MAISFKAYARFRATTRPLGTFRTVNDALDASRGAHEQLFLDLITEGGYVLHVVYCEGDTCRLGHHDKEA